MMPCYLNKRGYKYVHKVLEIIEEGGEGRGDEGLLNSK